MQITVEARASQLSFFERKALAHLECRLAIAERDLRLARARCAGNAIDNAIEDVNRFRAQLGKPLVPQQPPHVTDPSLKGEVGRMGNGTVLYANGFGFSLGQRVALDDPRKSAGSTIGRVAAIFEYGRQQTVHFEPEDGRGGWWVSPRKLKATPQVEAEAPHECLIVMPCSGMKLPVASPARDIYTGVMWQTYRTHQPPDPPRLVVLSAEHGFLRPDQVVEPYERKMDRARAMELMRRPRQHVQTLKEVVGPARVWRVYLVGGKVYQAVMRQAVELLRLEGVLPSYAMIQGTSGGIGEQRAQLGAFLRSQRKSPDS